MSCNKTVFTYFLLTVLYNMFALSMTATYISRAGYEKLVKDLESLKKQKGQLSNEIGEAREKGDLKENAEYHAAKERQSLLDVQIRDIEDKIARAEVIDVSKLSGSVVRFGATVTLADSAAAALNVLDERWCAARDSIEALHTELGRRKAA